jgi:hypothetical protein
MLTCNLNLRPVSWFQSVEHHQSINVEGRRFLVDCTVGSVSVFSVLKLSNDRELQQLPAQMQIFETTLMQDQLGKLPQGALGSFSFHDYEPARDDLPSMEAILLGWFVLNAQSLEDVWNQVMQGGYSECTIMIRVGPIEHSTMDWLWDITKTPRLIIDSVSISFKRLCPAVREAEEKKISSWWRG